jgi:uncharacterized protein
LYRLIEVVDKSLIPDVSNPFIWRQGVGRQEDFFGRDRELKTIRDFLLKGQNKQIVGERRMGKTALLQHIVRLAPTWNEQFVAVYADPKDARYQTVAGFLSHATASLSRSVYNLVDFGKLVDEMTAEGKRPVLCIDEFERLMDFPEEFNEVFLDTLRSLGNCGLAIVSASRKPLNQIVPSDKAYSPFYNVFDLLPLRTFRSEDVEDFLNYHRSGVADFTPEEKDAIRTRARNHPVALQVLCDHVFRAKGYGDLLGEAFRDADEDIRAIMPEWKVRESEW